MNKDLEIISKLQKLFTGFGLKVVLMGGYGIEGYIGENIRDHHDIDIDVVGALEIGKGKELIKRELEREFGTVVEKKKHFVIEGNVAIDAEYVQDGGLIDGKHIYKFTDGFELVSEIPLYLIGKGRIGDLVVDIENPEWSLIIKLLGPVTNGKEIRPKDMQDINALLRKGLDRKNLMKVLRIQLGYIERI